MELIYLYINEYRNFRHAEFNFSQDVRLSFDQETRMVTVSEAHFCLPEHFWGENINNLSMIVGNNGAGKTSLMQYLIDIFLEIHGEGRAEGQGLIVFAEGDRLYGYRNKRWGGNLVRICEKSGKYKSLKRLDEENVKINLGNTKMVYLTNALSSQDYQRGGRYGSEHFKPFCDGSLGSVIASNAARDVNRDLHRGYPSNSELEAYFIYEKYKQIKFVFDKQQYEALTMLKKDYPVPVPVRLYIDLLLGNYLDAVMKDEDSSKLGWELDQRIFPDLYEHHERNQRYKNISKCLKKETYQYIFLKHQLSRCTIWSSVRCAARLMDEGGKHKLFEFLCQWEVENYTFTAILKRIWEVIDSIVDGRIMKQPAWIALEESRNSCLEFLEFINAENLMYYFKIETEFWEGFSPNSDRNSITFSIATKEADWFMNFFQKYRNICNPDYFLDFHWGLSSGENSLLSMYASLYDIYDNKKQIVNKLSNREFVECESIILLIDEADLTYHPEWQRAFIALLTAFLPQVYPPQGCRNIQIVISTHSPILLGDVPQQNVIYLKRDPKSGITEVDTSAHQGTFGQNVHLLFEDSFFLEHGTMGVFAQSKIHTMLEALKKVEKEKNLEWHDPISYEQMVDHWNEILENECRPYAKLIAEPIIRRKVLMQIDDLKRKILENRRSSRYERMSDAEIEEEIRILRAEQDKRRND